MPEGVLPEMRLSPLLKSSLVNWEKNLSSEATSFGSFVMVNKGYFIPFGTSFGNHDSGGGE